MKEKNIVSFYNILIISKIISSKYNLCYMYIMCVYIIKYKKSGVLSLTENN